MPYVHTQTKTIVVEDLLLSYTVSGSETLPVMLYLHGWGDSKETFKPLIEELPEHCHISVDLPGFGGSQAPASTWGLPEYSACVASFVKKLSLQPSIIVGHSNGGAIAVYGLAHNELKAEKLILLASAGIRDVDQLKKKVLKVLAKSAKAGTKVLPKKTQAKLKAKAYSSIGSELLLVPGMEETFKKTISYDISVDATKITIPTLLIYGDADLSTPHNYGEKLHGLIPYAKLVTLPHVGHMLQHEEPKQVIRAMKEFIQNA